MLRVEDRSEGFAHELHADLCSIGHVNTPHSFVRVYDPLNKYQDAPGCVAVLADGSKLDAVDVHVVFEVYLAAQSDHPKKGPFLGPIKRVAWSKIAGHFIDPRIVFFIARVNAPDLEWLANLAREGRLKTVIDRRYPLDQTGEALDYLGGGHARGKVIIAMN